MKLPSTDTHTPHREQASVVKETRVVTTPRTAQKDGEVHHMLLFHTQNFDEFHARLYNQLPLLVGQPVSDCCSLP